MGLAAACQRERARASVKVVYIAAPLNAPTLEGREQNRKRAARWVAWAARQGFAPVAIWIVLAGEWDETPENRTLGLDDKALIERCDELWLCGPVVSGGMRIEAEHAKLHGIPVMAYPNHPWEIADTLEGAW
jgi:hypothetical protein